MRLEKIVCWEPSDGNDPMVRAAGELYEATLAPDERIPWAWIQRSVGGASRGQGRTGNWVKHLVLTAPEGRETDPAGLAGYAYGAFIPGYGGYLCYVGVADSARRLGVGTRLFEEFFRQMANDARAAGETLPFVVWESHRPEASAPRAAQDLWAARVRLFSRVGGLWVEGVNFLSPNFEEDDAPPVPLQLFVKPMELPEATFTTTRLRELVGGLQERVYRAEPGDPLHDKTLPPACQPRLVPAVLAGTTPANRGVLV